MAVRELQISPTTGKKPKVVQQLAEWEYLETSLFRILAGWGRWHEAWADKVAVSRHVWEQSEIVRRLRERLVQFPGTHTNLAAPVHASLEALANTVLLAPKFEDAIDGSYQILNDYLVRSYLAYAEAAHPVHDAPTVAILQEILRIKNDHRLWLRERRRSRPHSVSASYREAIERAIAVLVSGPGDAQPVGVRTPFRLPLNAFHPEKPTPTPNFMPYIEADFETSIEARRLFWCYGYMLEMNLAEDQLRWIWDAHAMPFEFHQDLARHMWDESRHGDSGMSRLLDFGIDLGQIGFPHYSKRTDGEAAGEWLQPEERARIDAFAPPMTAKDLYESVYFIGMVAETGHFVVKHEAYADFRDGGDFESAEMMLFDIIDETSHVQYAHRWLPELARRAGIDEDFRARGLVQRDELRDAMGVKLEGLNPVRDSSDPGFVFYQELLDTMRKKHPLTNADSCPPRTRKPM
ncbi:MAG: hypothetical protein ACOYON_09660 [Fimbriimonas sp.]